jgi:hypothetical protein
MDVNIDGVDIIKEKCENVFLSASFKTRIFKYFPDFSAYDQYLYLDTDIVALKPLPTFDSIGSKIQVYGYPARTQREHSFAGYITQDIKYTSKMAISSGILLFRPSVEVKRVFDDTYELYTTLIKQNKVNHCWEQPALCYVMIDQDMYDVSLTEFVYEERLNRTPTKEVFNHFCGLRGEARKYMMKKYLDK